MEINIKVGGISSPSTDPGFLLLSTLVMEMRLWALLRSRSTASSLTDRQTISPPGRRDGSPSLRQTSLSDEDGKPSLSDEDDDS